MKPLFMVMLALLAAAGAGLEFFRPSGGAHFAMEGTPFFHAWYGFIACALIVLASLALGPLLKRPRNKRVYRRSA